MRFLRHPVHPMLVAFPIALLGLTPLWDILARLGVEGAAAAAYFCELSGLIGAGLAIITGFADFIQLRDAGPRLTNTALTHAALALGMASLFAIAIALRGGRAAEPSNVVIGLEIAGALCLLAAGWFGGELVFHYGVRVTAEKKVAAEQKVVGEKTGD